MQILCIIVKVLAFAGNDMKWKLEEDDFSASAGGQKVEFRCTDTSAWK